MTQMYELDWHQCVTAVKEGEEQRQTSAVAARHSSCARSRQPHGSALCVGLCGVEGGVPSARGDVEGKA